MQKNRIILLTKTDGSLELFYGRLKAAHCSWGPGGPSRMGKMQRKEIHADLGVCVCVCVCPVSPPKNARVCRFSLVVVVKVTAELIVVWLLWCILHQK